jgi:hypothetical protein
LEIVVSRHPKDDGTNRLVTFADSDFAMDETRRSCMGMVISMNGAPISWTSTLGKTVATSTAEAEVNAAVVAAKDSLHLRSMLQELGIDHGPIILHEDNSACIAQGNGGLRLTRPNFAGYNKSLSMGMLFLNIVLQLNSLQTLSRNLLTWKRFLSSENGCLLTCRTCFEFVLHIRCVALFMGLCCTFAEGVYRLCVRCLSTSYALFAFVTGSFFFYLLGRRSDTLP